MEIIRVNNLGIKFKMARRTRARARELLVSLPKKIRNTAGEFWALRQVSFSINRGDTLGIIGRNGSGKSTLLRVIAGIYPPDEGDVHVNGEVSTLFSLGAGFQLELSGRDNIYLNGVLMGLSKQQIDSTIEKIIDFADLDEFIDMPVRTYSSGMHSRLGFAIAMNVSRDIVLIDEIMGTGDAAFRDKANKEMSRMLGDRTIIIVSHGMANIRKFANKAIWLDKGHIAAQGKPDDVIKQYLQATKVPRATAEEE